MTRCHICGKSGPYSEMIDHVAYSVHSKCEHNLLITTSNVKEFKICSICGNADSSSKNKLRNHLVDSHTKEALADLIVDIVY
jgi:hypothetical protein